MMIYMRKLYFFILPILLILQINAYAAPRFDDILSDKIAEYGIFENDTGIVYADEKHFESGTSLMIVHITESSIKCEIYDDTDGVQFTDSIEIPYGGSNTYKLFAVTANDTDYIMLTSRTTNETTEFFSLRDDSLTKIPPVKYDSSTSVAGYENGKPVSYTTRRGIFDFLNKLKERTISDYTFVNKVNFLSESGQNDIKNFLSASADLVSFDINNYDYDTVFKQLLYTHKNFQILTDIPAKSGSSSNFDYNNVSIVNSEYIDFIAEHYLGLTTEKPPVNNLINRGFCYNNGLYYYIDNPIGYFSTKIDDLITLYDLGNNTFFTIFSDMYYENNTETPEYSFAVIRDKDSSYSLLRIGMGEKLPSQEEIKKYANLPQATVTPNPNEKAVQDILTMPALLIIAVGIVTLTCGIIVLIKIRRKQ